MNRDVGHMETNAFYPKHHLSITDHSPHLEALPFGCRHLADWLELGRNREKGHGERERWEDIEPEAGGRRKTVEASI